MQSKYNILSVDIHFNSGYIIHITIVHTMGSHIVHTLKTLYVSWPEDGCNVAETCSHGLSMY